MTLASLGLIVFAYLVGSIPFSGLIAQWRSGKDLYEEGEGNVGARNVWHVVGPKWGVLAGALDALKGFLVYLVSTLIFHASLWGIVLSGFAVALGHQFPLYARGRGGKGLSTMAGFLAGVAPVPTAIGLGTLGLVYAVTREAELSALYGSLAIVLFCLLSRQPVAIVQSLGFGVEAGLKKLLDRNHEEQVRSLRPWHEANPVNPVNPVNPRVVFPREENNEEASS